MKKTITVRDIPTTLLMAARHKKSVFFYGNSGVGKSEVIAQVADVLLNQAIKENPQHKDYYESIRGKNVLDIRLANETPERLSGAAIPYQNEKGEWVTTISINMRYPQDPRWVGVILFDEASSADESQQVIMYQALNDRRIDNYHFPEGAVIAAAGNYMEDGGATYEMLSPVTNRLRVYHVRVDADVWLEDYALPNMVHPSIVSLIKNRPDLIHNYKPEAISQSFASPRSLASASNVIYDLDKGLISYELAMTSIEGDIGLEAATEWQTYHTIGSKLPYSKDVIKGKKPDFNKSVGRAGVYFMVLNIQYLLMSEMAKLGTEEERIDYAKNDLPLGLDHTIDYLRHIGETEEMVISCVFTADKIFNNSEYREYTHHKDYGLTATSAKYNAAYTQYLTKQKLAA